LSAKGDLQEGRRKSLAKTYAKSGDIRLNFYSRKARGRYRLTGRLQRRERRRTPHLVVIKEESSWTNADIGRGSSQSAGGQEKSETTSMTSPTPLLVCTPL